MNASSKPPANPDPQQHFLRLFLASEREIYCYVAALVPNSNDAQDIVQQAAILLWQEFDQYDPAQPFTPWACRFALNVARQWLARRARWKVLLDGDLAEQLLQRREQMLPEIHATLRNLEDCLQKLPPDQRALIDGYYFRQAGIETIARQANRSVDAIYKALQRIRQALQKCMENSQHFEGEPA